MLSFDPRRVPTPAIVCDLGALRSNLKCLERVQRLAGCRILLALKGYALWHTFPLLQKTLMGVAASSPDEARLGREEFGGEVHVYAPAYSEADVHELASYADHLTFNSISQWRRFGGIARGYQLQVGLRLNPEHSEVSVPLYDPCAPNSRLGVTASVLANAGTGATEGLDGAHVHALCQSDAPALERMASALERGFAPLLRRAKWLNLGGGHHLTRAGYDVDTAVAVMRGLAQRYGVQVYLEPGEAVALETGYLVASVLDIVERPLPVALLDTSASAHMPDVIEMPYRPEIVGGAEPGVHAHTYRLGGLTCLAGDIIGDYSFPEPLRVGDRLVFTDMAHYTMVKSTTFNGIRLPSIVTFEPSNQQYTVVRSFGYADYKSRLG